MRDLKITAIAFLKLQMWRQTARSIVLYSSFFWYFPLSFLRFSFSILCSIILPQSSQQFSVDFNIFAHWAEVITLKHFIGLDIYMNIYIYTLTQGELIQRTDFLSQIHWMWRCSTFPSLNWLKWDGWFMCSLCVRAYGWSGCVSDVFVLVYVNQANECMSERSTKRWIWYYWLRPLLLCWLAYFNKLIGRYRKCIRYTNTSTYIHKTITHSVPYREYTREQGATETYYYICVYIKIYTSKAYGIEWEQKRKQMVVCWWDRLLSDNCANSSITEHTK